MSSRKRTSRKNKGDRAVRLIVQVVIALSFVALGYFVFQHLYPQNNSFDATTFSDKFEVRGVDLSHHNEDINWDAMRDKDITFAYLKVTEGASICDKTYKRNYRKAKSNNIHVGTYHFFSFRTSGEEQAKHFIEKATCKKGDLIPAIDVEHSPGNQYYTQKEKRDKVIDELKIFEKELREHYGHFPIIYTNKECYKLYIKENFPQNPIWICDLDENPKSKIDNWVIWQFSHKGKIAGVSGHLDLNYYRYSFEKFKKLLM